MLCGNTDDHARNHAAFWNGETLTLTPAYDICPQNRTGREANQAMLIVGEKRTSTLTVCIEAAPHFLLSEKAAITIIEAQIKVSAPIGKRLRRKRYSPRLTRACSGVAAFSILMLLRGQRQKSQRWMAIDWRHRSWR